MEIVDCRSWMELDGDCDVVWRGKRFYETAVEEEKNDDDDDDDERK